jgi:AcrR family transcriptional regulator
MTENGGVASVTNPSQTPGGAAQRQHILEVALTLMSQRGVDGTSMRDLASAAGLNVATLYHYFPSKRDLLIAVLDERGFLQEMVEAAAPAEGAPNSVGVLADMLDDMLRSMLEVDDFIRLMLGEVMRGEETALALGRELLSTTQGALERWLQDTQPELCAEGPGAAPMARMLRSMLIGAFFEHVAGVLEDDDPAIAFRRRAEEAAAVLLSVRGSTEKP